MIYHQHRCLFIHIPKTGGNSVSSAFGFGWPAHTDILHYATELKPDVFESYFKFAVVRNPWERLVSEYVFQRKKRKPRTEKLFIFDERGTKRRFADWVRVALANPFRYRGQDWAGDVSPHIHRWSPQVDWISIDGNISVDFIARLETIERDFQEIRRRAGVSATTLARRNATRHRHYSSYYDSDTREIVAHYYASDIEAFGYRFEPPSEATRGGRAWHELLGSRWLNRARSR
ncbi:MAG TPA: sulfotransferase family 2 domain-containing protein [Gemmatimonadaceae bacterium]